MKKIWAWLMTSAPVLAIVGIVAWWYALHRKAVDTKLAAYAVELDEERQHIKLDERQRAKAIADKLDEIEKADKARVLEAWKEKFHRE